MFSFLNFRIQKQQFEKIFALLSEQEAALGKMTRDDLQKQMNMYK